MAMYSALFKILKLILILAEYELIKTECALRHRDSERRKGEISVGPCGIDLDNVTRLSI